MRARFQSGEDRPGRGAFGLELIDHAAKEVFVCQAVAGDLHQGVDDGGVVAGNSHWGEVLCRKKEGQEVS